MQIALRDRSSPHSGRAGLLFFEETEILTVRDLYRGHQTRTGICRIRYRAVKIDIEPAFLSELNSNEIFDRLKEKVGSEQPLTDEELMQLIILPLSEDIVLFAPGYSKEDVERLRKEIVL